jgi:hypothetical protein
VQADSIVPGPGNPVAFDRYAYTFNSPVVFSDPTGHEPIFPMIDGVYSTEYVKTEEKINQLLKRIALVVWAESSEAKHSDQSISWKSWVFFNRQDQGRLAMTTGAVATVLQDFGWPGGDSSKEPYIDAASEYFSRSYSKNYESYNHVFGIVHNEFNNKRLGSDDPTLGALFFIHGSTDNIKLGEKFASIEDAISYLDYYSSKMQDGYTSEMAISQGQQYPFTFNFSDIYTFDGKEIFLYVGNHVCISKTSCSPSWKYIEE